MMDSYLSIIPLKPSERNSIYSFKCQFRFVIGVVYELFDLKYFLSANLTEISSASFRFNRAMTNVIKEFSVVLNFLDACTEPCLSQASFANAPSNPRHFI